MFRSAEKTMELLRNRRNSINKAYEANDNLLSQSAVVTPDLAISYAMRLITLDIQDTVTAVAIHRRTQNELPPQFDAKGLLKERVALLNQMRRGDLFAIKEYLRNESLEQLLNADLTDPEEGVADIKFSGKLMDVKEALPFIVSPSQVKIPTPPWLEKR
jgi:hypothetical protein